MHVFGKLSLPFTKVHITDENILTVILGSYRILVRKPEGKRPLRRSRHTFENNVRRDHTEIGWEVVDRIHLSQDSDKC
jgi:hypothetical protein